MPKEIAYSYSNAPIPGGGYVTGLHFHEKQENLLYARTDIGGLYAFDYEKNIWKSLSDHIRMDDVAEAFPIAIATDPNRPNRLYSVAGEYQKDEGIFCVSEDFGQTWTTGPIPTYVHGNLSGRGTGNRLIVMPKDGNILYFASQKGGLYRTTDRGLSWEKLNLEEQYLTFVWASSDEDILLVGTAGLTKRKDEMHRGHSLYVSYDKGVTFEELPEIEHLDMEGSLLQGLVASRIDYDGQYIYITMNSTGRYNYIVDLGYSCDTGDVMGGRVVRYRIEEGRVVFDRDITPMPLQIDEEDDSITELEALEYNAFPDSVLERLIDEKTFQLQHGFGGISSCSQKPGLLALSSLCREKLGYDMVYRSEDYGNNWQVVLAGLEIGNIQFRTSYMKPEYNGNASILHWLSDIKINPHNPNEVWINSGTGVFSTEYFLENEDSDRHSDNHDITVNSPKFKGWHDNCNGIEETVHLNVYAPLTGRVKLVDIVGDLGGFAFEDLKTPCKNSFDDENGNRYITCINAGLSDSNPNIAVISARGNWTGKTKGGLIKTTDCFETFERIPMPYGINEETDELLRGIERPNVNPGWVAMSCTGQDIVWSVATGITLPANCVISSQNGGKTFEKVTILGKTPTLFKTFADSVDAALFYGFDEAGNLYISKNHGKTFIRNKNYQGPKVNCGMIDTANGTEIRPESGGSGVLYMATGEHGLFKITVHLPEGESSSDLSELCVEATRLTKEGDAVYRMGLGLGAADREYIGNPKMIYFCGICDGEYGFYRSPDECKSVYRINTDTQMFGAINSIDADKRVFGRFFLGTGTRGVIIGEETND